jgi:N6-adenosine-specific RNA methylase IME4
MYMTAIIDPPWPYSKAKSLYVSDKTGARGHVAGDRNAMSGYVRLEEKEQYETLSIADLAALPVASWVDGYVLLWTTGPFMHDAHHLLEAWGFEPKTIITWVKTNADGTLVRGGVGFWYLGATEYVVIGKRKGLPSIRTKLPGAFAVEPAPQAFMSPRQRHSSKPTWLHEHVEAKYPGPWLELFARECRDGWLCLGNECPGDETDIRETLRLTPASVPSSIHTTTNKGAMI